jgi:IMP dehydrogenase
VKRAESLVVENPLTISVDSSVKQARQLMADSDVGGLVVVNRDDSVLGIVTSRDVLLAPNEEELISQVMTPRDQLILASKGETLEEARNTLFEHRIEKLPLVDSEGHLAGLITTQDILKFRNIQMPKTVVDAQSKRCRLADADLVRAALA